jgi:hypothetical protein
MVKLRPFQESDFNFILNSWLLSFRNSPFAKNLTNEKYYSAQQPICIHLMNASTILVACSPEEPKQIFGYIVAQPAPNAVEGAWVHYCYVKNLYRRMGIATSLRAGLNIPGPTAVTHWRPVCRHLGWLRVQL